MDLILIYVRAVILILGIMVCWLAVQHSYRRFATRHPEYGPAQEHLGCGLACSCNDPCDYRQDGMCTNEHRQNNTIENNDHVTK